MSKKTVKETNTYEITENTERDEKYEPGENEGGAAEGTEGSRENPHGGKKYRLTGSLAAKIVSFFLLAGFSFVGLTAAVLCIYMGQRGFYANSLEQVQLRGLKELGVGKIFDVSHYLARGNIEEAQAVCENTNMDVEMIREDKTGGESILWGTWDGYETEFIMEIRMKLDARKETVILNGHKLRNTEEYLFRAYFKPDFPEEDNLRMAAMFTVHLYEEKFGMIALAAGSLLMSFVLFIFLMCSAGHKNGQKGIVPGPLTEIHLDVLTFLFGAMVAVTGNILLNPRSFSDELSLMAGLVVGGTFLAVWITMYCMEFALRVKLGKCWKYSLCYIGLKKIWKMVCFLGRGLISAARAVPLMPVTLTGYLGLCILEFMVLVYVWTEEVFYFWVFEKVVLLAFLMYIVMVCRKLLNASRALAQGRENYVVDTAGMPGEFKEHGENLNSLGQGISRAVAERLKSERLKTELISNVSHDLKTPLTSIINYADLIYEETKSAGNLQEEQGGVKVDQVKIREYAQVLLRQSGRLKKLLEDLLEASKATTGNLEVLLEPCQVGVLLSQAVGEYQQRMEEKGLNLIVRTSEEEVKIMADGRRLWRIFDNLLNNICKYAQEKSRVYLSVETAGERVLVIFRNMSKFPLDISADELEERFVRGDKSRHMEGNGLGLSIAKSLVELQNGRMDIVTDGDLFKVILDFPVYDPVPLS